MVRLLYKNGADVNSINDRGRTPLMEASLWGRSDVVKFLIDHNALKDMKDRRGRRAVDLAEDSKCNKRERAKLLSIDDGRQLQRQIITGLLADGPTHQNGPQATGSITASSIFRKNTNLTESTISLLAPVVQIRVQSLRKTMALLFRGDVFPMVSAVSGWTSTDANSEILNNEYWTNQVSRIATS